MNCVQGLPTWLLTSNVGKCMTVAIITRDRGLLFPMPLTSQDFADRSLNKLRTWWSENKDSFANGRLFVIMPDFEVHADANAKAHSLLPEIVKLTNLQAKVTDFRRKTGKEVDVVMLLSNGAGKMPAVTCNNEQISPAVPTFDSNAGQVQAM